MVNLIQKFVASSRAAGLRISTSELLDCLDQLQLIDVLDEPQFKAVLRANFAKSRREQSKFDRLYELFFHKLITTAGMAGLQGFSSHIQEILDKLKSDANGDHTRRAILEFLEGNPVEFLEETRRIRSEEGVSGQGKGSNLGALGRRLKIVFQFHDLNEAISRILFEQRSWIDWNTRRALASHFQELTEAGFRILNEDPRPANESLKQVKSYDQQMDQLGERPFVSLTRKEMEEMREVIEQLVRKLKDTLSRRYAKRNRGVLDVKKTLRRAAKYEGIPIQIMHRQRPRRKGKIVTLCDVSHSVWSAARFMLGMLYSLQECFTKVRSFVFVAGLHGVTETFENNEVNQAVEEILQHTNIDYNEGTDYGATFRHFKRDYMDTLNKKTTLIIIGDGRSNYCNPEGEILGEMRDRCRRVIWLNPESEMFWDSGDSEMRTFQAYCHEVRPCRNLNQLLDFIRELVL